MEGSMDLDGRHRVQALVTRPAVYVHTNDTLRTAAQLLVDESIGAALIRGPHGPMGIVSERDLVRAMAEGASPARTTVADIMTTDLVVASPSDELLDVVDRMVTAEVRHIPVIEDDVAVGVVSIREALRYLAEEARPS
jgi:CBS domain-containing protein